MTRNNLSTFGCRRFRLLAVFILATLSPATILAQTREATEGGVRGAARITHFFKQHSLLTEILGGVVSAGVSARGLQVCRQQNVENCTAHYGGAWASYGAAEALHFTAIGIGHKIGGKTGAVIAHGSNAVDLGYGAWEWHGGLNKSKGDNDETHHPDFRSVVIIRR